MRDALGDRIEAIAALLFPALVWRSKIRDAKNAELDCIQAALDGDRLQDIAVLDGGTQTEFITPVSVVHFNTISVLRNQAGTTWEPEVRYRVAIAAKQVITADLDGDGNLDLATANHLVSSALPHSCGFVASK